MMSFPNSAILAFCLLYWVSALAAPVSRPFTEKEQSLIKERLLEAGLGEEAVNKIPLSDRDCYTGAWRINLHGRDAPEYYRSFQSYDTVHKLMDFLEEQDSLLTKEEVAFGVPRHVVGAILMIESRLGRNWGSYRVPDLYLSLLLLPEHANGANLDSALVRESRDGGSRSRDELQLVLEKRSLSRGAWAAKEFMALQSQFQPDEWDSLLGSWAGAMGLPQFIPSSLAAYGADGDGDGQVNLYELPDAIMSIGNYLRENGWKGRITEKKRRKVIRRYNHSDNYVNAVLRLARDAGMAAPD